MQLNRSQTDAIRIGDGPAMILAGPGSGKTTVITHRVLNLIRMHRVPAEHILVITFTRAAAEEMRSRFTELSGGVRYPVTFGTFHSVFFGFLRHYHNLTADNIIKTSQHRMLLRVVCARAGMEPQNEEEYISAIGDEISSVKGNGTDLRTYHAVNCGDDTFRAIYTEYERQLRSHRLIDFDDMLLHTRELLNARPDILQECRDRYQYILIDEFQDINMLQYDTVRMLAAPRDNLFIVGDDDQSIYGFRGAKPEIMRQFTEDYPRCRRVTLNVNYRSDAEIVRASRRLIAHNRVRFDKDLKPHRTGIMKPAVMHFANVRDENAYIIRKIEDLHRRGTSYDDMAILFRTVRTERAIREALTRENIPFTADGALQDIHSHWVAQDIAAYLRLADGGRSRADWLRIINRPVRYVRRAVFTEPEMTIDGLIEACAGERWIADRLRLLKNELFVARRLPPYAAVNYIRQKTGYDEYLRAYAEEHQIDADELLEIADEVQEEAGQTDTIRELTDLLAEPMDEERRQQTEGGAVAGGVTVSTIHKAKGLEYDAVFIPDAIETLIPYRKAKKPAELEEERRLFYVAVTRARDYLYICWCDERYNKETEPSRFIGELRR